jgi:predicted nucleic acid-binding protein
MFNGETWPELHWEQWKDTADTLHLRCACSSAQADFTVTGDTHLLPAFAKTSIHH